MKPKTTWSHNFDERQLKEIMFARKYAKEFSHGTDGHHRLIIISLLADLLDRREENDNASG